jgi:hypothetical protein
MLTLFLKNLIPQIKNCHFFPDEYSSLPHYLFDLEEDINIELNNTLDISNFTNALFALERSEKIELPIGEQAHQIFEYGLFNYLKNNKNISSIHIDSSKLSLEDKHNTVVLYIDYQEDLDERDISVLNYCFMNLCSSFSNNDSSGLYSTEKFSFEIEQENGHISMKVADYKF